MARMRLGWRRNVSIGRVISAIVSAVLILYVGGQVLMYVADSMLGTCSPFYQGLSLIGWTVNDYNTTIAQETARVTSESATYAVNVSHALLKTPVTTVYTLRNSTKGACTFVFNNNAVTLKTAGASCNGKTLTANYSYSTWTTDHSIPSICNGSNNILSDVSSAGVLVVVGLIAVAAVILQFVELRMA